MLSLFKPSAKKIVQKIHNEIDTAQDRLLQQAEKIIAETSVTVDTKIIDKAARLKKLGFANAVEVATADHVERETKKQRVTMIKTKEEAELLQYYKQAYPFHKFLTEEELQRICDKYGLIYAPVASYIKDVPEKNLSEIENATRLKKEDAAFDKILVTITDFWSDVPKDLQKSISGTLECYTHEFEKQYLGKNINGIQISVDWFMRAAVERGYKGTYNPGQMLFKNADVETVSKEGLFIAAPRSYFNLDGLGKQTKHGYFSSKKSNIKDPIVFRHCRGKMIRVETKWGLEASDESLVNETMN